MKIIISPAKKMKDDTDSLPYESLPVFLNEADAILARLRRMRYDALKALWRCNDSIAALNWERLNKMNLRNNLTPAILSYEGIQYRYMAPGVFETEMLSYLNEHLRILSGFYGLLRPFDGVAPYRLEMQAKLSVGGCRDLYAFWGGRLAGALCETCDFLLNLASHEYSRAVLPHLPESVRVLTCAFGEEIDGRLVEKGTLCKMARGEMVRFLAEHRITIPGDIAYFNRLGYAYSKKLSTSNHYVFLKEKPAPQNVW